MGFFKGNEGRTEKATGKRRQETRQKGNVPRSRILPPAVVLLVLLWLLGIYGSSVVQTLTNMMRHMLAGLSPQELTAERVQQILLGCALDLGKATFLLAATAILLSIGANFAQGGLTLSTYPLKFHFDRLNPATGILRLLPKASGIELLKTLFTIGIVAYFGYSVYLSSLGDLPRLLLLSPMNIAIKISSMVYQVAFKSALYLVAIAMADVFWVRHQFEEGIKMTKQEVKDEAKNQENPEIRSRIKSKQREVFRRWMMAAVPKADVVITNPTHFAVALSYLPGEMAAPVVVAKGQDHVALRIREIAEQIKVPLVENKPLAQTLYKTVDVGQMVPGDLFKAVAEVLAYVYKLKQMRL